MHNLEGAWRLRRIEYISDSGTQCIEPALPGLFIFQDDYYSMTWHPGAQRQLDYQDLWHPTNAEKIESYNAVVTNAGQFKIENNKLHTYVQVAKTPAFEGGQAIYSMEFSTAELILEILDNLAHDGTRDTAYLSFRTRLCLSRA